MNKVLKNYNHERFCLEYIKCGSPAQAYRKVYGKHVKAPSSWAAGARLKRRPDVTQRIQELQMRITRRSDISYEKILNDYQEALEMARAKNSPSDMIAAAREQARLTGLLVERKEFGQAGEFDKMENISEIIEAVKEEVGDEAAQALLRAFDLLPKKEASASITENTEALLQAEPESDALN